MPSGYFHPDSGVTPFISDVTCSGTEILLSECSTRHDGDGNGFENDNSTNGDGDNDDDFHPVAIRCDGKVVHVQLQIKEYFRDACFTCRLSKAEL